MCIKPALSSYFISEYRKVKIKIISAFAKFANKTKENIYADAHV